MTTKVVPREPTPEIIEAMVNSSTGYARRLLRKEAVDMWQSGVDAAYAVEGERQEPVADEARAHLCYVLPMAKAWAHAHPVGRNQAFVDDAIAYLEQFAAASPVEPSAPPDTPKCIAGCGRPSLMPASEYCAQCAQEQPAQDDDALLLDLNEAEGYVSENRNVHTLQRLCVRAAARLAALRDQVAELRRANDQLFALGEKSYQRAEDAVAKLRAQEGNAARGQDVMACIEWVQPTSNSSPSCPYCGNYKHSGHVGTCKLAAAIAAAKPEGET